MTLLTLVHDADDNDGAADDDDGTLDNLVVTTFGVSDVDSFSDDENTVPSCAPIRNNGGGLAVTFG